MGQTPAIPVRAGPIWRSCCWGRRSLTASCARSWFTIGDNR